MVYRIKTLDGIIIRKKATRPYVVALVKRAPDNKVTGYHSFSINPDKHKNYTSVNGYLVEPVIFERLS